MPSPLLCFIRTQTPERLGVQTGRTPTIIGRPGFGRVCVGRSGIALFLNFRLLATKLAEIVELCTANIATADEFDVIDNGRVDGKGALNAHLEAHFTNREGFTDALTRTANDNTLENLDARAIALNDIHVNLDSVSGAEFGNITAKRRRIDGIKDVHNGLLSVPATGRAPFRGWEWVCTSVFAVPLWQTLRKAQEIIMLPSSCLVKTNCYPRHRTQSNQSTMVCPS